MFPDTIQCACETAMLAFEATTVVGLRLMTFWGGGRAAVDEAQEMISEKWLAGAQAALRLGTGGTPREVVGAYRRVVHANHERLAHA